MSWSITRASKSGAKILTGKYGELLARRYLRKQGYAILASNAKTPTGELDIIAKDGGQYVFIEVKTRTNDRFGTPAQAVDDRKRKKMIQGALFYLKELPSLPSARFDVIAITLQGQNKGIVHIKDAFEL